MKKLLWVILSLLILAIPAQAQEPEHKLWLPVVMKTSDFISPPPDNQWRIIAPQAAFNYVLNPSAETTGNFSNVAGATTTRSTTFQKHGLYSYQVVTVASGDGTQFTTSALTNVIHWVTVRVRKPYPTLQASLNSNAKTLIKIEKIDANWDLLGVAFSASEANGATALQILANDAGTYYLDGIQAEPSDVWTTYIDGAQPGCVWLGTANASISERSGQSRAGGISYDFWKQYSFRLIKVSGAGASPHNLSVDSYSQLPGGELNSDKIEPRDWTIIGEFIGDSEPELHDQQQALEAAFQTDDNQLTLVRFNGASVQKEIGVRYQGGLDGDLAVFYGGDISIENNETKKHALFTERVAIQLQSPYPFWLEVGESAAVLDTNDSATFRTVAGRLRSTGQWDALGPPNASGTYNGISAIAEDDTYVYFGGNFTNFDNIANADYIVRWHKVNQAWSALGTGMNNIVFGLLVGPDGTLYATGQFTTAGGGAANRIASWDGSAWSALGSGLNDIGRALTIGLDGTLYVTGDFTTAGGGAANRIASWDGSAWSALSSGLNGNGFALATGIDGTIYVGGDFTTAGGSTVNRIASWDGTAFADLDGGMDSGVRAIAIREDGLLYAGGLFVTAGSISAADIASWNGTSWSALGSGMNSTVLSLSIGPDSVLYAAGDFTTAGGITVADQIAKWNNFTWGHLDLDLTGTPGGDVIFASQFSDPVIEQNYDIYLGHGLNGTGTFGGATTVSNDGSVQAFPKIVYHRSGGTTANLETLRNETTGKEILFDYGLLDGETLTVDLEPTVKEINSSFFGKRQDAFLPNSDFAIWALQRGDNNVTTYINESGTPTITAWMQWRDAFSSYN